MKLLAVLLGISGLAGLRVCLKKGVIEEDGV